MEDWSHYLTLMEKYTRKASDDCIAAQSCGEGAKTTALRQAEEHLLEAISYGRDALAAIRGLS